MNCKTCNERPIYCRELCQLCYQRAYHKGTLVVRKHRSPRPNTPWGLSKDESFDRIGYTVDDNGCWNWNGAKDWGGYGGHAGRRTHRVMFERVNGPVPEGLVLDHLCRNTSCMNPVHLEAVTQKTNRNRGEIGKYVRATVKQQERVLELKGRATAVEAAEIAGVSFGTVYRIWKRGCVNPHV